MTDPQSGGLGLRPRVYDRIVRIVSLVFIGAILISIEVGNLWPETNAAILVVLGSMMLFLVLVQDVIPPSLLGRRRYILEGVAGIGFITALVVLTGGSSSPFFFGYFLIVSGAALWITGTTPILLALLTALAYLVGLAVAPVALNGQRIATLPAVGFNLLALGLMAFLAHVAGREQRRISERALKLSRYDALTQLFYRAYFLELLDREIQRAVRTGRGFCLLMLDLDDLKPINDTFGHPFGDRMLRAVGDVIRREIRASDVAARYGGDEFMIMLPETEPPGAIVLAEKLRADIAHIGIRLPDRSLGTSVSIGLASFPADGTSIDQLIRTVDQAMYEAKRLGKNRIAYRDHGGGSDGDGTDGDAPVGGQGEPVPVMQPDAAATAGTGEPTGTATLAARPAGGPATGAGGGSAPSVGPGAVRQVAHPSTTAAPGGPSAASRPRTATASGTVIALREPPPAQAATGRGAAIRGMIGTPDASRVAAERPRPTFPPRPATSGAASSVYDASEDPFGPWLRGTRPTPTGSERRPTGASSRSRPAAPMAPPPTAERPATRPSGAPTPTRQAAAPGTPSLTRTAPAAAAPATGASAALRPPAAPPPRPRVPGRAGPPPEPASTQRSRLAVPLFGPAGTPGRPMPASPRRSTEPGRGPLARRIASGSGPEAEATSPEVARAETGPAPGRAPADEPDATPEAVPATVPAAAASSDVTEAAAPERAATDA